MVGRERLRVVGKVLLEEPGLRKTEGMEMRMTELSGNEISKRISSRKNSKKGFTLVELLVVLVILAILAAVALPFMLGFTDSAKEKKYISDANSAMKATQSMLSDAYTNNMVYIPQRLRDQALKTSGLEAPPATAFYIHTVKKFRDADGTYNSIGSYTIATALYKASADTYVYFDGTDWNIVDADSNTVTGYKTSDYYISVWPADMTDTAGNKRIVGEGEESTEEIIPEIGTEEARKDGDDGKDDIEIPESTPPAGSTLFVDVVFYGKAGVVTVNGGTQLNTKYDEEVGLNESPSEEYNSTIYKSDSFAWKCKNNGESYNLDEVKNYLGGELTAQNSGKKYEFEAEIDEKTISIPLTFRAYDPATQIVKVVKAGAKDLVADELDENKLNDTISVEYGLASRDISPSITPGTDVTVVPNSSEPEKAEAIVFDDKWAINISGVYQTNEENDYIKASGADGIKNAIGEWVDSNINSENGLTETEMSQQGITFVAPAEINKTVYVRGTLDGNNLTEEVKFKVGDSENSIPWFDQSFVKYELTGKIYEKNGDARGTEVSFDGTKYSIFDNKTIYVSSNGTSYDKFSDSVKKLKFWRAYSCSKNYNCENDLINKETDFLFKTREKDCTEQIINKLYDSDYKKFGEVAEIDVSRLTTKLDSVVSNNYTSLRDKFKNLAGDYDKINSIQFINGADSPENRVNYANSDKEICISTTKIAQKGDKLSQDGDHNYIVLDKDRKDDYPGYTVAYRVGNAADGYTIYVITEDGTNMKADGSYAHLHDGFVNMTGNSFVSNLDTETVTDMGYMFQGCSNLGIVDISNFVYSNVKSTMFMFKGCSSENMTSISLSGSAPLLENTSYMFQGCNHLTSIDLSGFDNSRDGGNPLLTNTKWMFDGDTSLTSLDISGLNTVSVTDMNSMFRNCGSLQKIGTTDDDYPVHIDSVVDIGNMFYQCASLQSVKLTGSNTNSSAENAIQTPVNQSNNRMYNIFNTCGALEKISINDLAFSSLNSTGFNFFFQDVKSTLTTVEVKNVSAPGVTSFAQMFGADTVAAAAGQLNSVKIIDSDFSGVTSMNQMFRNCQALTSTGVNFNNTKFDSCTNTSWMFAGCVGLTGGLDFKLVDTKTVADMSGMFNGCINLTKVKDFHIDRVSNMQSIFAGCSGITEVNLVGSNTDNSASNAVQTPLTTDSNHMSGIFSGCSSLNKLSIKNLLFSSLSANGFNSFFSNVKSSIATVDINNVSAPNVNSFALMFGADNVASASGSLTTVKITNSDFSGVSTMNQMFRNCQALTGNSIDFGGTSTSCVNTSWMFGGCIGLSGKINLSSLSTSNVTDMNNMFNGCTGLTSADTGIITSNAKNMSNMFNGCTGITTTGDKGININSSTNLDSLFKNCTSLESVVFVGNGNNTDNKCLLPNNGAPGLFDNTKIKSIVFKNLYFDQFKNNEGDNKDSGFHKIIENANAVKFNNVKTFKKIVFENVSAPNIKSAHKLFSGCDELTYIDVSGLSMSSNKSTRKMFEDCFHLTGVDDKNNDSYLNLGTVLNSNVTNASSMFNGCYRLQSVDLSRSDTSGVTDMWYMFSSCYSLTILDLSSFDTSSCTRFECMFDTQKSYAGFEDKHSNLTTIKVSDKFVFSSQSNGDKSKNVFGEFLVNLVGGNGTHFTVSHRRSDYAIIDGTSGKPGYFTGVSGN